MINMSSKCVLYVKDLLHILVCIIANIFVIKWFSISLLTTEVNDEHQYHMYKHIWI